jgi:hypothetical protein
MSVAATPLRYSACCWASRRLSGSAFRSRLSETARCWPWVASARTAAICSRERTTSPKPSTSSPGFWPRIGTRSSSPMSQRSTVAAASARVLAVAARTSLVCCGDFGFDVRPAGRHISLHVGDWGGGVLPKPRSHPADTIRRRSARRPRGCQASPSEEVDLRGRAVAASIAAWGHAAEPSCLFARSPFCAVRYQADSPSTECAMRHAAVALGCARSPSSVCVTTGAVTPNQAPGMAGVCVSPHLARITQRACPRRLRGWGTMAPGTGAIRCSSSSQQVSVGASIDYGV